MKLSDIKQLTCDGKYQTMCLWGSLERTIQNWIDEDEFDINPDFQRGHVWNEEQQIAFIEYLLSGGKMDPLKLNHPNWMGSFEGQMVCVDGLQRLTAIRKFIANKLSVFNGNYIDDFEDKAKILRKFEITFKINNLKTRKEVLNWYLEINDGGTPHTKEEINRVKELLSKEN